MPFSLDDLSPRHRAEAQAQLGKQSSALIPPSGARMAWDALSSSLPDKKEGVEKRGRGRSGPKGSEAVKTKGKPLSLMLQPSIALTLPYPPSLNTMYATVLIGGKPRRILSRRGRAFKKAVEAIVSPLGLAPFIGPVGYKASIYRPRRIGDTSNVLKSMEDALAGYCYANDEQISYIEVRRHEDKLNPRAEITLFPVLPT